jgi:hypothetical protein
MANETKENVKVEGTLSPEVKASPVVDTRAISLAKAQEDALAASARAEADIEASKSLATYSAAGLKHRDTILSYKASEDYACEKRGVATTWTPAIYDSAIGQITVRMRATNPEMFLDFDALKEDKERSKKAPSNSNERIHSRLMVGVVAELLVSIIGEKVWSLPYRVVANYLVYDRVVKFSKQDVKGELRPENAEFLRTNLSALADGKMSTAEFVAQLKQHYDDLAKEAADKAAANLTPEQRALAEKAKAA